MKVKCRYERKLGFFLKQFFVILCVEGIVTGFEGRKGLYQKSRNKVF